MRHVHHPDPSSRDDGGDGTRTPYREGCHATCHGCRRRIVFVIGYELRRDYWRLATRRLARA